MDEKIFTMELFTKAERIKFCPFSLCEDNCSLKGITCEIENILKAEHKTALKYYDPAFQVRW